MVATVKKPLSFMTAKANGMWRDTSSTMPGDQGMCQWDRLATDHELTTESKDARRNFGIWS
jgi:hypothetical protein